MSIKFDITKAINIIFIHMSLLTKFRTILYIFRIFYWLAFKAVVKGYLNGSTHLYVSSDAEHNNSGPKN